MLRGFFGNLIFAIFARMLCGNHLNYSFMFVQISVSSLVSMRKIQKNDANQSQEENN